MTIRYIENVPSPESEESKEQDPPKITLKATKIQVRKTGMNSGITGGGSQCC